MARRAGPAPADRVIVGRPGALRVSFATLVEEMRAALAAIPGERA